MANFYSEVVSNDPYELLDDLATRFIINLPIEELESLERLCFHLEMAHWFYDDFYRDRNRSLPNWNMKEFASQMFQRCPLLRPHLEERSIEDILATFLHYKVRVPVCGAIILNPTMDKVLLVKGWTSKSSWGFPKGKINKDEKESDCAKREVFEETGFDASDYLVEDDYFEVVLREQKTTMFILCGVPEDTKFTPRTRKEISKIEWVPISELPTSYNAKDVPGTRSANSHWSIIPFINKLRRWIDRRSKMQMDRKKHKKDKTGNENARTRRQSVGAPAQPTKEPQRVHPHALSGPTPGVWPFPKRNDNATEAPGPVIPSMNINLYTAPVIPEPVPVSNVNIPAPATDNQTEDSLLLKLSRAFENFQDTSTNNNNNNQKKNRGNTNNRQRQPRRQQEYTVNNVHTVPPPPVNTPTNMSNNNIPPFVAIAQAPVDPWLNFRFDREAILSHLRVSESK